MNRGDYPAFPYNADDGIDHYTGLTIREEFAARMAQGLVAGISSDPASMISGAQIAGTAVALADDLLAALDNLKLRP
jgi:hypothetical protein